MTEKDNTLSLVKVSPQSEGAPGQLQHLNKRDGEKNGKGKNEKHMAKHGNKSKRNAKKEFLVAPRRSESAAYQGKGIY
jgi:hypothetical protein